METFLLNPINVKGLGDRGEPLTQKLNESVIKQVKSHMRISEINFKNLPNIYSSYLDSVHKLVEVDCKVPDTLHDGDWRAFSSFLNNFMRKYKTFGVGFLDIVVF